MPLGVEAATRALIKRAQRGLYAGRQKLFGNKISEDGGNRCDCIAACSCGVRPCRVAARSFASAIACKAARPPVAVPSSLHCCVMQAQATPGCAVAEHQRLCKSCSRHLRVDKSGYCSTQHRASCSVSGMEAVVRQ